MQQQAQGQIFLHHREGEVLQRSQENGGYPEPFDGKNDQKWSFKWPHCDRALESWLIRGSIPKRPYFRLVKYYNLPRSDHFGECPKNSQRYHDALNFLPDNHKRGPKALCQRAGWPTIMEPFRPGFSSKPIRTCRAEPVVVSKHWLANCFLFFMFFVCFFTPRINPYKSRISLTYKHK